MTKNSIFIAFPPLDATGLTASKSTHFGTGYPKTHAIQLQVTGEPSNVSLIVEGKLAGADGWIALATLTDGDPSFIVDKPIMYVRGNLGTLTAGEEPTVQLLYLGVP
jgi:hypothetical protein